MSSDRDRAEERLTTTSQTGGVRVRMKPEGLAKLAARGDAAKLRQQISLLEADQHAELMALLAPAVREELVVTYADGEQERFPVTPRRRLIARLCFPAVERVDR